MNTCLLKDRGIVSVSGEDAETFLNRLITNSVLGMKRADARYAALLSPQGKLLFDFIVSAQADAFWLDAPRAMAADLARRLAVFKLRAKVVVETRDDLAVAAAWGGALMEAPGPAYRDPRHNDLGYRIVAAPERLQSFGEDRDAYEAHRIALGVPAGGIDFAYGDTFVHDANLDILHGVDFDKGCYVGQEVVSRVHHRGSARKRVVHLAFYGDPPPVGTAVESGSQRLGDVTSVAGRDGLAMARIDRLEDAEGMKIPVLAGGTLVGVTLPAPSTVVAPSYADGDF